MRRIQFLFLLSVIFTSCGTNHLLFTANRKYSLAEVDKDYTIYQRTLETHHPSLYWYTSRDSMDYYFAWGRSELKEGMTEPEFRRVLSYVTSKINCGHTSVRASKRWTKYTDTVRLGKMFPLSMKVWEDTMVVSTNLHRRDTVLTRGTVITKINGRKIRDIVDTMFNYIPTDGYNRTHKFQTLSNRGFFGSLHTTLFGLSEKYLIEFQDSLGHQHTVTIPVYNPISDTGSRTAPRPFRNLPKPSRKERKQNQMDNIRLLRIDSVAHTAMMDLATFGRGYGLRKFFRHSFAALRKNNIRHLIIDVRSNGGGSVTNSTALTRYITTNKFKIGDSLYASKTSSKYDKYIQNHFWNKLFISFFTRRRNDDKYHFGYFERHFFRPKSKNHFDGKVYVLTGGNSFSATTLFASALKEQDNVTIVGEETGGGAYGNSAWLIPDVTLPKTKVRFRLPLFRLVINHNTRKDGHGVQPEVNSLPTVEAIRRNRDFKVEKALQLIELDKNRY